MKPEREALVRLATALSGTVRLSGRSGPPAAPWAASALGAVLFLLACGGLHVVQGGGAVLLFLPSIAWEVAAFGPLAGLAAAALAALAWGFAADEVGIAPYGRAVCCVLAAMLLALVDGLLVAISRGASALSEALRDAARRETLFAEAQHRIGNNLTVICAALNLQARKAQQPATKRSLQEASERVLLIAEVNRMLVESGDGAVRFDAAFIERLVGKSIAAAGAEGRVCFSLAVEPIEMRPDFVLPVALVLGECVSNALEHGFPGDATGRLEIRLEAPAEPSDKARLTIADDGAGAPAGFDSDRATTTGLTLIRAFTRQVDGVFRLESDNGTRSIFMFSAREARRQDPFKKNPGATQAPGKSTGGQTRNKDA
jgi:two-component sensor histidine kinase